MRDSPSITRRKTSTLIIRGGSVRIPFMKRLLLLFLPCLALFCSRLSAHQVDQEYNLSVTVEKTGEKLVETVYVPAWFLMSSAFPKGATYAGRSGKDAENAATVTAWMAKVNPVLADGVAAAPSLRKMRARSVLAQEEQLFPDFFKESGFDEEQFGKSTTVQLEFTYTVAKTTKDIAVRWGAYISRPVPEGPPEVLATSVSFFADDKFHISDLTPKEPEWVWHSDAVTVPPAATLVSEKWEAKKISIPWAALVAGGAGVVGFIVLLRRRRKLAPVVGALGLGAAGVVGLLGVGPALSFTDPFHKRLSTPDAAQSKEIFDGILHGVYKAFEYNKDGQIYDALALCVDGPLLEKTYKDVRSSLILDDSEGGALCQVDKVEVAKAELQPAVATDEPDAVRLKCSWSVRGKVSHWGHTHIRANAYEAVVTLAPRVGPGGPRWKLTGCDVTQQNPVEILPEKKP